MAPWTRTPMMRAGLVAALDVGTTKVSCFIAQIGPEGGIRVVGVGHHVARGVRGGAIADMEAAETSILTAVGAAEQMAGERLRGVVVNLTGGHPISRTFGIEVAIAGHEVGESDLHRIHGHTLARGSEDDRELIHCIPIGYAIDGSRGIRDPRGMYGDRLGVDMHLVSATTGAYRNLAACIARCHLDIDEMVVSPYASGLACLVEDEMDLGATVIDMGGGCTSIAVFYDGSVIHTDVVPIGGAHVTSDIARGLSTPLHHAERMKTLYGSAMPSAADDHDVIDVPLVGEEGHGNANHVPRSMLMGIIRPRLEETFELVRERLDTSELQRLAGRRLVLTGGASQLPGMRELAALMLEKQARIGRPLRIGGLAEATSGPAFSTCAGLLKYAVQNRNEAPSRFNPEAQGIRLGKIGQWLREHI